MKEMKHRNLSVYLLGNDGPQHATGGGSARKPAEELGMKPSALGIISAAQAKRSIVKA